MAGLPVSSNNGSVLGVWSRRETCLETIITFVFGANSFVCNMSMGYKLQEGEKLTMTLTFCIPLMCKKFTLGYFDCKSSSLFFLRWGLSR